MKIAILIPHTGRIEPHTLAFIDELVASGIAKFDVYKHENNVGVRYSGYHYDKIADARNHLVRQVMASYDYVLFNDSDVSSTPDVVAEMIAQDVDIIASTVELVDDRRVLLAGYWLGVAGNSPRNYRLKKYNPGVHRVDWASTAQMLVRTSVFYNALEPWFFTGEVTYKGHVGRHSEDIGFCIKAAATGYEVYALTTPKTFHSRGAGQNVNYSKKGGGTVELQKKDIGLVRGIISAEAQGVKRIIETMLDLVADYNTVVEYGIRSQREHAVEVERLTKEIEDLKNSNVE